MRKQPILPPQPITGKKFFKEVYVGYSKNQNTFTVRFRKILHTEGPRFGLDTG